MRFQIFLLGLLVLFPNMVSAAPLVGAAVPDFHFQGVAGATYRLSDYLEPGIGADAAGKGGGKGVVIAWFPKAFTPG